MFNSSDNSNTSASSTSAGSVHAAPSSGRFSLKNMDRTVLKNTLQMAWPSVVESFFVALAGMIDSFMVSTLGANSVAAIGLTTQPKFCGLAIFIAINVGASALVARRRGERRRDDANKIFSTVLLITILLSILITVLFVACADPIIRICGSTADTHEEAVLYFKVIMAGTIFNTLSMVINSVQRGAGNTRITMKTNLTSSAVNIIFNYLLIGGHLGFPALGIFGAAFATVLGTVAATILGVLSVCKKDSFLSLPYILKDKLLPTFVAFKSIMKISYSLFFEQFLMRVGFTSTAIMAANMGTYPMAAHQVGMNIMSLSFAFGDGLQAAAVALIGRSLGERKPDLAKNYGNTCQRLGTIICIVLAVLYFFLRYPIYRAFFEEPEIIEIGAEIMLILIVVCLFQIRAVVYMGSLRGAGDTAYTAMASIISVAFIRTAVGYIACYPLGLGIDGIWLGVLADQVSRFLFASIRYRKGKWTSIKI